MPTDQNIIQENEKRYPRFNGFVSEKGLKHVK